AYLCNEIDVGFYLRRHLLGDDGDVSEDQHQRNLLAQRDGLRSWSIYKTPENPDGEIWVITEADRSVTDIMFSSYHVAPDPYDANACSASPLARACRESIAAGWPASLPRAWTRNLCNFVT